ncbi:MAG: sugar ABC transporter ATP-binding protein [Solirubrobacteraceae bacterium]
MTPVDAQSADAGVALRLHGVTKRYPGTLALDDASLSLRRGAIHALVGGNGSGKSTAIKILAGVVSADAGEIEIGGERYPVADHSVSRARERNLRFVHQQSSIFPDLTVAENLSLGRGFEHGLAGRIRWSRVRKRTRGVLERFEIAAAPDTQMAEIGPASQMMVAIARALQDQEDAHESILVLDEPTASLPSHEVKLLLDALRRYAAQGQTVLYVTHRLHEVTEIADAATVLRDGRVVGTLDAAEVTHDRLVEAITGRALALEKAVAGERRTVPGAGGASAEPALRATGIGAGSVDLTLSAGEITGIAGLLGSGRSAILRSLFGLSPAEGAEIFLDGRRVDVSTPSVAVRAGIAYVPEDRADAALADESITRNLSVTMLDHYAHAGWVDGRVERAKAREAIKAFGVRAASEQSVLSSLSGGNAQKVMLARWMQRDPRVLLLDEPSQGVDVGARAEIHALIRKAASGGAAVAVVSSDFEELAILADRVLVVSGGEVVGEAVGAEVDADAIESMVYAEGRVAG